VVIFSKVSAKVGGYLGSGIWGFSGTALVFQCQSHSGGTTTESCFCGWVYKVFWCSI